MKKPVISWLLLFACNFMWSLQFTCIKLTQDQVGPFSTVWIPMTLATIFMFPFVLPHIKAKKIKLKDLKVFAMLALLGQFPAQVLVTIGTQHSTASNGAIINLSFPVVSALLAYLILKEKMNRLRWVSFIIAIAGVLMCSFNDIMGSNFSLQYIVGNLLILSGVFGSGLYNTICKKIADGYTEMEMLFYTYIFMVLLLTPLVFIYERDTIMNIPDFTTTTITGLTLLTIFHNFLSMILFFMALKNLEAIQVALSNFLVTFFGVPIAALWLHEQLGFWSVVGGLLVLVSTLSMTIWDYQRSKSLPTTI